MTRRTFLAASLIGGLMLAVGMRPRVIEPKERPAFTLPVWIRNGRYSYDEGKTWTDEVPKDGTPVARIMASEGHGWLMQTDLNKMPKFKRNAVEFDGTQSLRYVGNGPSPMATFRVSTQSSIAVDYSKRKPIPGFGGWDA